jgi:SpoIID/LytB domain protein
MLKRTSLILVILAIILLFKNVAVQAAIDDSCKNISGLSLDAAITCQQQVEKELNMLKTAIKPNEDRLNQLKIDINQIIKRAAQIGEDLKEKENLLAKGKNKIAVSKKIFDAKVRQFYKHRQNFSPILIFFAKNQDVSKITKELAYQQKTADADKKNITSIALYVKNVEEKKKELENENTRLTSLQASLTSQIGELEHLLSGAKSYETVLASTIAKLSARQQDLIAQRIGSLHLPTSLGGGPLICSDDRNVDPGFGNAYAFFSYGIPHRVGMNQYGAKGRAEAGQSAETILSAYYPNTELKKDYNTAININVTGNNEMGQTFDLSWDIETYVKHIYEMPTSWDTKALMAQAVAARSYALAYTNNGASSICATQACQVVKQEENSEEWKNAVDATRGWVLVSGGQPISAWFASTAGGYTWGSGDVWCDGSTYTGSCANKPWTARSRDTNGDVGSFGDLASRSYDRDSPCFYSAQGWRSQYGKSAWLKSEEVANIVNALLLSKALGSAPDGIESWSSDKIKQELKNKGGNPFNSVNGTSVSADFGIGKTNNITISGDAGNQTFDGLEFRNIFNLVAPANIAIVGPLYNVERK